VLHLHIFFNWRVFFSNESAQVAPWQDLFELSFDVSHGEIIVIYCYKECVSVGKNNYTETKWGVVISKRVMLYVKGRKKKNTWKGNIHRKRTLQYLETYVRDAFGIIMFGIFSIFVSKISVVNKWLNCERQE